MSRTFLSITLNFFFLPMGYLYLKNWRRFIVGMLYSFFATAIFSGVAWLLPALFPLWLVVPILLALSVLILAVIIGDTYRLSKQPVPEQSWPIFSKPHAFWFIPLYWVALTTLAIITEPWEKPFAKTHHIPSPAMEPNVQIGDFVFVDYMFDRANLKYGDIIVHEGGKLHKGKRLIKRIVGMPGDRIELKFGDVKGPGNEIFSVLRYKLNGKLVPLEYRPEAEKKFKLIKFGGREISAVFLETQGERRYEILEDPLSQMLTPDLYGVDAGIDVKLGDDEFYVLGDNRDHSSDSRHHGAIKRSEIVGKYMFTYFSFYIPDDACEMNPAIIFLWRTMTAKKKEPCGSVEVRWEKVGYMAR